MPHITLTMRPLVKHKISIIFSKFQMLFQEKLNQYKDVCALFEYIFHADSKYSNEVKSF